MRFSVQKGVLRLFLTVAALCVLLTGCATTDREQPAAAAETPVSFSLESGAYPEAESLELVLEASDGATIVYTTDGSVPTADSPHYDGPILIDAGDTNRALIEQLADNTPGSRTVLVDDTLPTATVVRAAALSPNGTVGPVSANTYFVGEDLGQIFGNIAVFSLVADPADLLDYERGIMALGAIYDENRSFNEQLTPDTEGHLQANYTQKGKEWERPASIELFDGGNELSFEAPCGVRLQGTFSRIYAQKGFNIYFREDYGWPRAHYAFWENGSVTSEGPSEEDGCESFALRAGGNSTELTRFKDTFLRAQVADYRVCVAASRPAAVFLNGEFYGVCSMNERFTDVYVQSHFGVSPENVVLVEDGEIDEGTDDDQVLYDELLAFADRDLRDQASWDEFCSVVDIESMVDYYAIETYLANDDFNDQKNCLLWRARESEDGCEWADTRWRWILKDLDMTAGIYDKEETQPDADTVGTYLETCPLFASAMRNEEFRRMMRERLVSLSEGAYEPGHMDAELTEWWDTWAPWIEMGCKRFNTGMGLAQWELDGARRFFASRGPSIIAHFDTHAAELEAA